MTDLKELPYFNPDAKYNHGVEIPHRLQVFNNGVPTEDYQTGNSASIIVKSSDKVCEGDIIESEYGGKYAITKIMERRKAKGDWSANPFDTLPDFVLFTYL